MSITEIFIRRPVLSTVLNLLIVIVGILAYRNLGVREYPNVSIPIVSVQAFYPNASAQVVESDLTFILEEQLAGVGGLQNMTSWSSDGMVNVTLTFRPGTKMESALAQIRDRVGRARSMNWPKDAKEPLIEQQGNNAQPFFWFALTSPRHSFAELTHFVRLHIKNQLQTIRGVASLVVDGQPYTMMISLNRLKMYAHGIGADDVVNALSKNQVSLPAGKFREEIPVTLKFALEDPEDFDSIVVKKTENAVVLLRDIADVALASDDTRIVHMNGKPAVFVGIVKSSDGNPLEISDAARKLLPQLKESIPEDVHIEIEHDGAKFIRASLTSINTSIIEAALLVLLIIFLFLRNVRSTLIPLITIPISLIGTLAFVSMFGFSLNTISLLALVLAVGLVVDDAIVVLENIHRHIEHGLSPLEAAKKGSREIAFAIIAMTLTLASVYAPIAFIGGTIGQLFIEFALTLAAAVVVSGIVALTLSPMMCSRLLRADQKELLPQIDVWLKSMNQGYQTLLSRILRHRGAVIVFALAILVIGALLFWRLPTQLAPREDRGVIGANIQPLPGKPPRALLPYVSKVEDVFRQRPEVKKILAFGGNEGVTIVAILKDWSERSRHSIAIIEEIREDLKKIPSVNVFDWNWDTDLPGLEQVGADRGAAISAAITTTESYKELSDELDRLQKAVEKDTVLKDVWHDMHLDFPGLSAKIDRNKMALLEISPLAVAKAMETMFDKSEAIEFLKDGLRYKVTLKGDESPTNLHEVYVTNAKGSRVPLSTFVELNPTALPQSLTHTNQMRSANFGAQFEKGQSLNNAVQYLQNKFEELPDNFSYEFTGATKLQRESSSVMLLLFVMALIFIYCVMAIQFESFVDPFIILLTVPLAACGALFLLWCAGQSINIFSQIGLITLVGLITKHGILIVDFANGRLSEGKSATEAILESAGLRLRPILMTTGAMVFGSIPLMIATGAGAEARRAIGYVLVGGLVFGTFLTLFVIPSIYLDFKSRRNPFGFIFKRKATTISLLLCLSLSTLPLSSSRLLAQEAGDEQVPRLAQAPQRFFVLQPTSMPKKVTLAKAIALALQNNENIQAANEQVEGQRGLRRQTLGNILPKLDGRGGLAYFGQLGGLGAGTNGIQPQASLNLHVPLVDAPGIVATQNAYANVDKLEYSYIRSQETLAFDVARHFIVVVTAKRLVDVADSQLKRAEAKSDSVGRRVQAGDAPALDGQRAQILTARARAQLQNETTNYQIALGELGYFVGERVVFEVVAPQDIDLVEEKNSAARFIELAYEKRRDLIAQRVAVQIAERSNLGGWLRFLPTLELSANLAYPFFGAAPVLSPPPSQSASVFGTTLLLQLNLPLYDGGVRYGVLQQTSAKTREEKFRQHLLEREIALEVQGILADIERKKKLFEIAKTILDLTRSAQKSAENMYSAGQATSLDLINAQTELFGAESNIEIAKLELEQARLSLAYSLGEDIRELIQ